MSKDLVAFDVMKDESDFAYALALNDTGLCMARLASDKIRAFYSDDRENEVKSGNKHGMGPAMVSSGSEFYVAAQYGKHDSGGSSVGWGHFSEAKPLKGSFSTSEITIGGKDDPETDKPVSLAKVGGRVYMAFKRANHTLGLAWTDDMTAWDTVSGKGLLNSLSKKGEKEFRGKSLSDAVQAIKTGKKRSTKEVNALFTIPVGRSSTGGVTEYIITRYGPALGTDGEKLFLAFCPNGTDSVYFGTTSSPTDPANWVDHLKEIGKVDDVEVKAKSAMALAWFDGKLILAYVNEKKDDEVYVVEGNGSSWTRNYVLKKGAEKSGGKIEAKSSKVEMDDSNKEMNMSLIPSAGGSSLYLSFSEGKGKKARLYELKYTT